MNSNQSKIDSNEFSILGGYTLGVSHHKQEEGHWCGPASSLAVIDYLISGGEPSQQDLANDWDTDNYEYGMNTDRYNGTTSPDMARSINYWIDESWYVAKAENNSTNLWAKLKFATDYQHPVNILVDTKYLSWYNGKSVNHFLTARGYSQDTDGTNKKFI